MAKSKYDGLISTWATKIKGSLKGLDHIKGYESNIETLNDDGIGANVMHIKYWVGVGNISLYGYGLTTVDTSTANNAVISQITKFRETSLRTAAENGEVDNITTGVTILTGLGTMTTSIVSVGQVVVASTATASSVVSAMIIGGAAPAAPVLVYTRVASTSALTSLGLAIGGAGIGALIGGVAIAGVGIVNLCHGWQDLYFRIGDDNQDDCFLGITKNEAYMNFTKSPEELIELVSLKYRASKTIYTDEELEQVKDALKVGVQNKTEQVKEKIVVAKLAKDEQERKEEDFHEIKKSFFEAHTICGQIIESPLLGEENVEHNADLAL